MSELRSIHLAIELATSQRDALAQAHAQAQRNLGFSHDQMAQLQGYARDTDVRWMGASSVTRSAELIRHHYQFMERLQQAINLQVGVMDKMQQQLAEAHKALLQAEFRLSGLNQILKSRQAALLLRQKRREQQQTDEFAALMHTRKKLLNKQGEPHEH